MRYFASPCPVTLFTSKIDNKSICDISGNLWQHTRSPLSVLPGFKVHYLYDDFTLPTIDGRHFFLTGGSFISLGNCASAEGRYGFRRHFYQFAGIRYVTTKNNADEEISVIPPVGWMGNWQCGWMKTILNSLKRLCWRCSRFRTVWLNSAELLRNI